MKEVYWFFNENEALYPDQCQKALREGRIQEVPDRFSYELYIEESEKTMPTYEEMLAECYGRPYTVLNERDWQNLVYEANQRQMDIVNDPKTNLPMLKEREVIAPTGVEAAEAEIKEAKAYLASTDWIAAKCYEEGIDMHAKYPEECAKRAEARARINEIEAMNPALAPQKEEKAAETSTMPEEEVPIVSGVIM